MVVLNGLKELVDLNCRFARDKIQAKFFNRKLETKIAGIFAGHTVLNGPFSGLRYPGVGSVCSSVYPKLLGSYEKELQPGMTDIIAGRPPLIIDIGCAEGYYAVGLARCLPDTRVVAADISAAARKLCQTMAALNSCMNVEVVAEITPQSLQHYDLKNAWIICDCEGYELALFTTEAIRCLKYSSRVIETHDFIDLSISEELEKRFKASHHITVIPSLDDLQKPKYYDYPEIAHLSKAERKQILAEGRPAVMEWLILTPKTALTNGE
ncbi:MAG TPA: class I SAM-dependent methyltransferase [Sphingobacteriaceae bacterium]